MESNEITILKRKIQILAFILIAMTACCGLMTACCGLDNKITSTQDTMDVYFQEFTDVANKLTPEQLQYFIKTADTVLERLQKVIESDETNPEEQFEARRSRNHILKEKDIILKALEKL